MASSELAVARIAAFGELGVKDLASLEQMAAPVRQLGRGKTIRHEGDPEPKMYLLLSGWTESSMLLPSGERQSIKVHLPGDLLGMPGLAMRYAPDTIRALTEVQVTTIEPRYIGGLFKTNPRIAAMLFLVSQEERVFLMDRLASVGRTGSLNRIAALIAQLSVRIGRQDRKPADSYFAPLTQSQIGDMTGMTAIHVNRTLHKLELANICIWRNRTVTIIDRIRLQELAGFPSRELAVDHSWLCDAC